MGSPDGPTPLLVLECALIAVGSGEHLRRRWAPRLGSCLREASSKTAFGPLLAHVLGSGGSKMRCVGVFVGCKGKNGCSEDAEEGEFEFVYYRRKQTGTARNSLE
jgi:hypothetical protein